MRTGCPPTGAAFFTALLVLAACAGERSEASLRLKLPAEDGTSRNTEPARGFGALAPAVLPVFVQVAVQVVSPSDSVAVSRRRVAVLAADAEDGRIEMVDQAVSFWNGSVSDLGLSAVFADAEFLTPPEGLRPFENYAHQLSQLAGRLRSSDPGPSPPKALFTVEAEVVVLLSAQNLMPFAWPLGEDGRHFVAVPAGDERENVVRNVIAHELGHVLGLKHVREPGVLMCHPCDASTAIGQDEPQFLPLTEVDRERLRSSLAGVPARDPEGARSRPRRRPAGRRRRASSR